MEIHRGVVKNKMRTLAGIKQNIIFLRKFLADRKHEASNSRGGGQKGKIVCITKGPDKRVTDVASVIQRLEPSQEFIHINTKEKRGQNTALFYTVGTTERP
jgi:hypothetical protein